MSARTRPADADLYVDGELSPEAAAAFERRLTVDEAAVRQVEISRRLRTAVTGTILAQTPVAPADLADHVLASLDSVPEPSDRSAALQLGRGDEWAPHPRRANLFAIAASLTLVAGAVLFGIFGPQIRDRGGIPHGRTVEDAASFASSEHARCSDDESALRDKMQFTTIGAAEDRLARVLGATLRVPDLSELGYEFNGGGVCRVPGAERHSAHLIYSRNDDTGVHWLSLFAASAEQPYLFSAGDSAQLRPMEPLVAITAADDRGRPLHAWFDGQLTWFLRVDAIDDADAVIALTDARIR